MTRINLLPWREQHRLETNKDFYVICCLCLALAATVGFGGFKFAEDKVKFQEQRNNRLNSEIAQLQEELKEIEALEETKSNLLARIEIIQQLQLQRPQIVHTFYEIASRLPDGIYLKTMEQKAGQKLLLEGEAESNARVSALMRRMDRSDFFKTPRLDVIQTEKDEGFSSFKLSLTQDRPGSENDLESDDGI